MKSRECLVNHHRRTAMMTIAQCIVEDTRRNLTTITIMNRMGLQEVVEVLVAQVRRQNLLIRQKH